jgi:hypothetical protein
MAISTTATVTTAITTTATCSRGIDARARLIRAANRRAIAKSQDPKLTPSVTLAPEKAETTLDIHAKNDEYKG